MQNQLLNTTEAARLLGVVSKAFHERDRWAGARIPFICVGARAVRYRRKDLEQAVVSLQRCVASMH